VGTAQWQYVLPNKRKASTKLPYAALQAKAEDIASDIRFAKANKYSEDAEVFCMMPEKKVT
jgi:hypothetical protein